MQTVDYTTEISSVNKWGPIVGNCIVCKWKQLLSNYSHLQPLLEVKVQRKDDYLY